MPTPRIAAIHDLSGFGRCALTIVIPVLSAMGVQCCPLPTALLSTHTGGFQAARPGSMPGSTSGNPPPGPAGGRRSPPPAAALPRYGLE